MTYQELKAITKGKHFPIAGKNVDGENVLIHHGTDDQNFFLLITAQNNGWTRENYIFEDGSREEFFKKSI